MSNPQQPELRRSAKGESVEDSQKLRVGREQVIVEVIDHGERARWLRKGRPAEVKVTTM